jgi:hypothetical protein
MTETEVRGAAENYRKQASDCREQSERAPNGAHKENWLHIARRWERLAEVAERYAY